MNKKEIVKILLEIAKLLELSGADFFKVRAYNSAARALEASEIIIDADLDIKELLKVKGIGKAIAEKVIEYIKTGDLVYYKKLKDSVPEGLLQMLKIPGLGPKKIKYLHDELGITTIRELEFECQENFLIDLPGFGKKTQENILKGIEIVKRFQGNFLYGEVIGQAEWLLEDIKDSGCSKRASLAGSIRRKKETVKDIDIVSSSEDAEKLMDFFTTRECVRDVISKGETKSSIRLESGIAVDLRVVDDYQYPYALHHFTGSKEHNTAMRSMAKKKGVKMNEYGLFKGLKLIPCKDEEEIFSYFGMKYIEPELREDYGEIEAAGKDSLPELIKTDDIKGLLHIHTDFSDGSMSIERVLEYASSKGLSYLGFSEHSLAAQYAGGLDNDTVFEYLDALQRLQKGTDIKIFKGIESDIMPDGSLDFSEDILKLFDFVIIAIHTHFNMDEERMTDRIIEAMRSKYATILAHPTGRILLAREPYKVNIGRIIEAAAEYGITMEINANPYRLDLDWRYCKYAKDLGVKFAIDPDAHNEEGLSDYVFGLNTARKGWLEKDDVINTFDTDRIIKHFKSRKV